MGSSNHDLAKFGSSSASRKLHEISADIALVERYFVRKRLKRGTFYRESLETAIVDQTTVVNAHSAASFLV